MVSTREYPDPLGLTAGEFVAGCGERGVTPGCALTAYRNMFRSGEPTPGLAEPALATIVRSESEDSPEGVTTKFVQRVRGLTSEPGRAAPASSVGPAGSRSLPRLARELPEIDIESVLIPMIGVRGRRTHTLCVSSQVGCALGCEFCETAQMGLVRSLRPGEIVGQWFAARFGVFPGHEAGATPVPPRDVKNIVFMGMGEPMDNLDAVTRAIRVLSDHNGAAVPMSNITISTVGVLDGIRRLGELMFEPGWRRVGLAVSINAPNDEVRSRIMPINRSAPMGELRDALLALSLVGKKKLCFGYVLIPGVNDAREHARELGEWVRPFGLVGQGRSPGAVVNLIPYNPRRDSPWPAPAEDDVERFIGWLHEERVFVKRRRTKGRSRMAACGQLGTASIRARRVVGVQDAGR